MTKFKSGERSNIEPRQIDIEKPRKLKNISTNSF